MGREPGMGNRMGPVQHPAERSIVDVSPDTAKAKRQRQRGAMCNVFNRYAPRLAGGALLLAGVEGCTVTLDLVPPKTEVGEQRDVKPEPDLPTVQAMVAEIERNSPSAPFVTFTVGEHQIHRSNTGFENLIKGGIAKEHVMRENKDRRRSELVMEGFETLDVSPELFGELVRVLPSAGTRAFDIERISIDPKRVPFDVPGLEGMFKAAKCQRFDDGSPAQIEYLDIDILKGVENGHLREILYTIVHEIFHTIDPRYAISLTLEQRVELLWRLQRIVQQPNSPQYGYDEKVRPRDSSEAARLEALETRATEFFPELMTDVVRAQLPRVATWPAWETAFAEWYSSIRKTDTPLARECAHLAARSLQFLDPDRMPWQWSEEWSKRFDQLMADHQLRRIEKYVVNIKNPMLKTLLLHNDAFSDHVRGVVELNADLSDPVVRGYVSLQEFLHELQASRQGKRAWDPTQNHHAFARILNGLENDVVQLSIEERRQIYLTLQTLHDRVRRPPSNNEAKQTSR